MALSAADGLASFDQSAGEFLDLSDVLAAVLLADTALLGRIPVRGAAFETAHYWMEDSLNATTIKQAAGDPALDNGSDTNIVLSAAPGNLLRVGALLKDVAAGKSEVLQVTAISGATITVTRGYGSSTAEAHSAEATFRIISQPVQENNKDIHDRSKVRVKVGNNTQIFKSEIEVSNTLQAVKQAGVPNELNYQIGNRTLELKRELGMTVIHGIKSASQGSDSAYRTMGGVREFITTASPANVRSSSESLDPAVVNALYRMIYDDGGEADLIVGSAEQISKFATMYEDKVRLQPSDRKRGLFVTSFLTDIGVELELLPDRWMQQSELAILDSKRLALLPLQGRQWHMEPLAKTGDGQSAMLVGEYTMEVRNAKEAHAWHTNLT